MSRFKDWKRVPLRENSSSDTDGSSTGTASKRKNKKHPFNDGKCYHGIEAVLLKSRTENNLRRWFFRCSLYKKESKLRCEYFVWIDEVEDEYKDKAIRDTNLLQHSLSWEYNTITSEEIYPDDACVKLLFNQNNRMRAEINDLRKLIIGLYMKMRILCVMVVYNLLK
ncbi:uncharacterized protein LOC107612989 [Arachis ipaensis]|uniref:GRF-type domain-containing protein n=1 Tax=Arachis hypogaea TaxID=3818 RepID=A0A444XZN9_ARAHY|nr:uncharacterized protein LOC107612989 [Arachis ipaensis]QHN97433.1 uncharacterized protein DS421_18g627330 [Arachis hypogaea]RYQ95148.1 hypothetical protein Ahy_B08g090201 [Arachis hypogaea]